MDVTRVVVCAASLLAATCGETDDAAERRSCDAEPASAFRDEDGGRSRLSIWFLSDPHVWTDLSHTGNRPLYSAILDSYEGGVGKSSFAWDFAVVSGDYTGTACPTPEEGTEIVAQIVGAGADPSSFYGLMGNHDAGEDSADWFERFVDPLGRNFEQSRVCNARRPFPVDGSPLAYGIDAGNIRVLMLSDLNFGPPPFGRTCAHGHPAGRVSREVYDWWVDQVEQHQDKIIITVSHQALFETTIYTGEGEGVEQKIHGNHSWADETASSYIYAIGDWTIDGYGPDGEYIGERPYGFVKYLEEHPGAIDLWVHGHTHSNIEPGKSFNGRADVRVRHDVTFVNAGALTRAHAQPMSAFSRLLDLEDGSTMATLRTYVHEAEGGGATGFVSTQSHEVPLRVPYSAG